MQPTIVVNDTQTIIPLTEFTVARYALEPSASLTIREALPFVEQVRRALISHRVETTHSETIVGKTIEGKPLVGHLHAHYWATDEDSDGRLDHVTIYAPRGFDIEDIKALKMIRSITRLDQPWRVNAWLIGFGQPASFDTSLFGTSKKWRSVTPFSLPRYATRGAGKPPRPRDLPEAQLRCELRVRGVPEPIVIKRIEGYAARDRPVVPWPEFQARRFKGKTGHGLTGFEVEFIEEVSGPVALGFACHFGLGLFMPA